MVSEDFKIECISSMNNHYCCLYNLIVIFLLFCLALNGYNYFEKLKQSYRQFKFHIFALESSCDHTSNKILNFQ